MNEIAPLSWQEALKTYWYLAPFACLGVVLVVPILLMVAAEIQWREWHGLHHSATRFRPGQSVIFEQPDGQLCYGEVVEHGRGVVRMKWQAAPDTWVVVTRPEAKVMY